MTQQIKFQPYLMTLLALFLSLNLMAQNTKTYFHNQVDDLAMQEGQAILKATGEPITGRLITNYDNGQIRLEGHYVNGQKQGAFRWWHPSGQLGSEEMFVDNQKEGLSRMWYANGQIKQEGNFKNGALKGRMKYWAKDGSARKISKGQ